MNKKIYILPVLVILSIVLTYPSFGKTIRVKTKDNAIRQECRFSAPILKKLKYNNQLEMVSRNGYMEKEIEKAIPRLEEIKENELINEGNKAEIMDTLYYITKYFEKEASTIEGRDDLFVLEDNITNNLLDRMNSLVSKQKEIIEFFKYN